MEFNKIFAAILVAGITFMLANFIAEQVMHQHELEKNAIEIEGGTVENAGGAEKAAGPEPILDMIASADVSKGEKLSKACAACHSFDKGGPAKIGPNLYNIVGGPKAHMAGFDYSSGLRDHGGAWSYADLNKFLWKPKKLISDTKMNFIGLKKPEDRAAMIAWLRTLSDSPDPLPGASEISAEKAEFGGDEEAAAAAPAAAGEASPTEAPTTAESE